MDTAHRTLRPTPEQLPDAVVDIVRSRIPGAEDARITNWHSAPMGRSTETYLFDVVDVRGCDGHIGDEPLGLVLRRPPEYAVLPDFDLRRQYLTMQRLGGSGVPVPTMRWIDPDTDALGTPYFVMDRIDGVSTVSDMPPYHQEGIYADTDDAGRARYWNGCVDLIAATHAVDVDRHRLGFLALDAFGAEPAEQVISFLRHGLTWAADGAPMKPAFTQALSWLEHHTYQPSRMTLCWGDSRMSNVLYAPDRTPVAAVDWEVAYLGDPAGDLAWMFLTDWVSSPLPDHASAAGTPSRAETLDRYEQLTGHRVENMLFADVAAALLLGIVLIRLNTSLGLDGIDLTDICAQRLDLVLGGGV
uniref:phosphotransferase family protein n=1 Tax=Gordonia sp. B7-2 TaxID=3420932 RepID=UPI003D8C4674